MERGKLFGILSILCAVSFWIPVVLDILHIHVSDFFGSYSFPISLTISGMVLAIISFSFGSRTIALIGLGLCFLDILILGWFWINSPGPARVSVSLSINTNTSCIGNLVTVGVSNDGTANSDSVNVVVSNATGSSWSCTISSIPASGASSCQVTKSAGAGYYQVVASSGATATPRTPLYCSS